MTIYYNNNCNTASVLKTSYETVIVTISDLFGNVINTIQQNNCNSIFDLSNLTNGVYVIKAKTINKTINKTIIIY